MCSTEAADGQLHEIVSFDKLAAELLRYTRSQATLLVGVDGGGGAGKSTFAASLRDALTRAGELAVVVHMDDFYVPFSPSAQVAIDGFVDGELDWERLLEQVIAPLKANRPARYQRFDWPTRTLQEWHDVAVGGVVIVEGIGVTRRELAPLHDFKVWVQCPRPTRLDRGVARDGEKARERWESVWLPADDRYLIAHQPVEHADLVVDGSGQPDVDPQRDFVRLRA